MYKNVTSFQFMYLYWREILVDCINLTEKIKKKNGKGKLYACVVHKINNMRRFKYQTMNCNLFW